MRPTTCSAAQTKHHQLLDYIARCLVPHEAIRGVVAIGSVATGLARADSDIDSVVFLDPLDLYITPAESIWRAADDTHHSIFTDDSSLGRDGIQLDTHRVDLAVWRSPDFEWPEHRRAELADGWVAYDRTGEVAELVAQRTSMQDSDRQTILDQVLVEVAGVLPEDPAWSWRTLGPVEAFDRLQSAYESLARGLFAYNHKWRPWRSRALRGLRQLRYLPDAFRADGGAAATTAGADTYDAYDRRARVLRGMLDQLVARLQLDRTYGTDPVTEAFIRINDEPGRAWNMDAWVKRRRTVS